MSPARLLSAYPGFPSLDPRDRVGWRPAGTTAIAGALVLGGFLLTSVSWWFLLLAAAGTFGPGILRELGLVRDCDEFQRRAHQRAAYHAFLTTGVAAFALVAYFRSGVRALANAQELVTLLLVLLWFAWFLSSLVSYWGARKAASRVLYAFGAVWLFFAILSNSGPEWRGWGAMLLHPLIAAPFLILGWTAGRHPRITGAVLLAIAACFVHFFDFLDRSPIDWVTRGVTFILLLGPLLASGIALLTAGSEEDDEVHEGLPGARSPPHARC